MITINAADINKIFQNTRIRFQKENKKSDEVYLDIFIDELQLYFNKLNTFVFDDGVFIGRDKQLSLRKYLYSLNIISDNIGTVYRKNDDIVNEINKLINVNIYERDTIIKKLDKIHNFVISHTISSEQNADYTVTFREYFNDSSNSDKRAGSENIEIDNVAGMLKLKSIKNPKNVINNDSVRLSLTNREQIPGITFFGDNLSIGDLNNLDDDQYFNKNEATLRSYLSDDELDGNQVTSTPFEILYTKINYDDIPIIKSQVNSQEPTTFGKVEIKRDYSFLTQFVNDEEMPINVPELILTFDLTEPTLSSFFDLKFDNNIPSLIRELGFIKGNVYDEKKAYKITNLDFNDNKSNFPAYRIYWGKMINLQRVELYLKSVWEDVPINITRWETAVTGIKNVSIRKVFFTERFDSNTYYRITNQQKSENSLVKEMIELSKERHGRIGE